MMKKLDELNFQWKEREDDPVNFQVRLIDLHKKGLYEFLRKEITGISDDDFEYKHKNYIKRKRKAQIQ